MVRHTTTFLGVLESLLGLLAGLVVTFRGYRLAKTLGALAGFLAGLVLGLLLGVVIAGPIGALIGAIVLGILFAVLFAIAFRLAGAALGAFAAVQLAIMLGWPGWAVVVAGATGLVVGLFANKLVLIVATSWLGATLATTSAVELITDARSRVFPNEAEIVLWTTAALTLLGVIAQARSLRHEDRH